MCFYIFYLSLFIIYIRVSTISSDRLVWMNPALPGRRRSFNYHNQPVNNLPGGEDSRSGRSSSGDRHSGEPLSDDSLELMAQATLEAEAAYTRCWNAINNTHHQPNHQEILQELGKHFTQEFNHRGRKMVKKLFGEEEAYKYFKVNTVEYYVSPNIGYPAVYVRILLLSRYLLFKASIYPYDGAGNGNPQSLSLDVFPGLTLNQIVYP